MTPSFVSCLDELDKIAEVQNATWPRVRRAAGQIAAGGAAMGLGAGAGHLLARGVLPRVLPNMSEKAMRILSVGGAGLGAAGGLALTGALARHNQMLKGAQ